MWGLRLAGRRRLMATKPRASATPRLPLNRERVLRAALDLADRDGIEALSMRKLGRELGVEAMSLYNHVANKDDLLDGLADMVVGEIEVPSVGDDWKAAMRRRAISAREMLTRHPWAVGLIESRTTSSPTRSRYSEAVVGNLRQAGFSVQMAVHAFFALDSHIYGSAVQEQNLPSGTPQELAGMAEMILGTLPSKDYPYLNEVIVDHVLKAGFDYADEFEFGLDLILDGLERLRDTA
jgi:AcrR family transcriptional regulator